MTQRDKLSIPPEPTAEPSAARSGASAPEDGDDQAQSRPQSRPQSKARRRRALTERHQRFITHYLVLGNVTRAALAAGFSPSYADAKAYLLLRHPDVAAAIAAEQGKARARAEITVERIVAELAKLAFADPRDLFTAEGGLKPIHELDEANAASIAAMEVLVMAGTRGTRRPAAARETSARSPSARSPSARSTSARSMVARSTAARRTADGDAGMDGEGTESAVADTPVLELRKIKRWDKTKALELLGRYLGLFKDRVELGVSGDLAQAIEAARKRVRDGRTGERELGERQLGEGATVIEGTVVVSDGDERAE